MKKSSSTVSLREYSRRLGITHTAVSHAIKNGKINKGVQYVTKIRKGVEVQVPVINKIIADTEWGSLHKTDKLKPGQRANKNLNSTCHSEIQKSGRAEIESLPVTSDDLDGIDETDLLSSMKISKDMVYGEASRRRELIGLAMDKKKLQELEGLLVRKDVVDRALFILGSELKKALFNIPARVTADVRAAANDVYAQQIITVELTQILNEFSKMQKLKLTN